MAHRGVAQEKALRLMLRPAADHRVHQDYISDHLELTGERNGEEEEEDLMVTFSAVIDPGAVMLTIGNGTAVNIVGLGLHIY